MAKALQHDQAALIARISTACATDNEPVPDTARSGHANAIVSQPRWYKKSVRSLLVDQAGWHLSMRLVVPSNITIIALPPKCPELNPVENVWQFMRDNWLPNR